MRYQQPDLTKLSDVDIINYLLVAESDKDDVESAIKKLKNEFLVRKQKELDALYRTKSEPFGVINIEIGDKKVKVDTPKKVDWAQDKLEALYKQIAADGGDPKQYIKAKYEVSETLYKTFGDNLKAYFEPARTVKAGNPSIKIEEAKE